MKSWPTQKAQRRQQEASVGFNSPTFFFFTCLLKAPGWVDQPLVQPLTVSSFIALLTSTALLMSRLAPINQEVVSLNQAPSAGSGRNTGALVQSLWFQMDQR